MRHSNYFIVDVGRSIQGRDRKTIRKPSIERIRAIDPELIAQQALTEPIEENNPYRPFIPSVDLTDNENYRHRYNLNDIMQPNINYPIYKTYSVDSDDILKKANDNYDTALANTIAVTNNDKPISITYDEMYEYLDDTNDYESRPIVTYKPSPTTIRIQEYDPTSTMKMRKVYGDKRQYPDYYVPTREVTLGVPFTSRIGLYNYVQKLKNK